ncbi:MAG: glycosyl hydrolase 53 family protein [Clostridia bacterium]|nr:glycosyl hydrolase 53 family protein [Clostridia bacterium]
MQEDYSASSKGLYVNKVESLEGRRVPFIMGMDCSEVPSIECARASVSEAAYKNFEGNEADVFRTLKEAGITDIRVRIWNDPKDRQGRTYGGGNCDAANAIYIAKRCVKAGLGIIPGFHYSDFWADPAKQSVPKAWRGKTVSETAQLIYTYTRDTLEWIRSTGVHITAVQIGNETTGGMCGVYMDWKTTCRYMSAASRAVRDVTGPVSRGGAKIAVHLTNAAYGIKWAADKFRQCSLDYDIFGASWYPYYSSHGSFSNLRDEFMRIHEAYGKDVMILETAYAFTHEDLDGCGTTSLEVSNILSVPNQCRAVRDIIQGIADLGDWGLGICYWGGTWISASGTADGPTNLDLCKKYGCGWATSCARGYDPDAEDGGSQVDNQAFFLPDGTPLNSLKVFSLAYSGGIT